ncbi:MAG: hypothetical protein JSS66_04905 [Armatimonadetes bacterium]|nr:hypothetical protein [Armatimonadota bacterium]
MPGYDVGSFSEDIPLVYYGNQTSPGVYLNWDRYPSPGSTATYRIERAVNFQGPFEAIETVDYPVNEFIDEEGRPEYYYRIVELDSSDVELRTSQPLIGEELLVKASLAYQVRDLLRVRVLDEEVPFNRGRTVGLSSFPNWNYSPRPLIRISSDSQDGAVDPMAVMSEDSAIMRTYGDTDNYADGLLYKLDYQGKIYFVDTNGDPVSVDYADTVLATYYVRMFTGREMNDALYMALQQINALPGVNEYPDVGSAPFWYDAALVIGATYWLIRSLMLRLTNRETRLLVHDPREEDPWFDNLKTIADMYKEDWGSLLKTLPKARYPSLRTVVTPEYYLPGGRSRFFRYVWKGGA